MIQWTIFMHCDSCKSNGEQREPSKHAKTNQTEGAVSVSSTSTWGFSIYLQNHDCECCVRECCVCMHTQRLLLSDKHTHVRAQVLTHTPQYIKSYQTLLRVTTTQADSETKPMISGQALLQTYLLLGPGWNGSTWSSQVKAGTAQWVPKRMSQDTANQTVYTDPKEKRRKKAQALLTQ